MRHLTAQRVLTSMAAGTSAEAGVIGTRNGPTACVAADVNALHT